MIKVADGDVLRLIARWLCFKTLNLHLFYTFFALFCQLKQCLVDFIDYSLGRPQA